MTEATEIAMLQATATIIAGRNFSGPLDETIMLVRRALAAPLVDAAPETPARGEPFVSAKKSVTHDAVTCMTCGFVGKSLKRHFRTAHGQTVEQYLEHWALKPDHPIVAPGYSETRSALAKANGLGKKVS